MSKKSREEILAKIRKACETIIGVEPEDITEDKIFCNVPDGTDPDHAFAKDYPNGISIDSPEYDKFLGMDAVDSIRFMFFIDDVFGGNIDDTNFIPRSDIEPKDLWRFRTVGELADFCEKTMG